MIYIYIYVYIYIYIYISNTHIRIAPDEVGVVFIGTEDTRNALAGPEGDSMYIYIYTCIYIYIYIHTIIAFIQIELLKAGRTAFEDEERPRRALGRLPYIRRAYHNTHNDNDNTNNNDDNENTTEHHNHTNNDDNDNDNDKHIILLIIAMMI